MGYSLIYTPVLHFDDINGRPLVGGKLYTYKAGTSTPAPTYRNSAGTELNENPIRLNERGECVCFLEDGLKYKFVLKDSLDNTIWEQDNVSIPASGGSGPVYVQESHTSSDSNVTVTSQKTTCTFDSNLNDFTGELHVRFQNSGQAATVTFYINNEYYDKAVSTLSVMSGITHLMVPVSVKSGRLRAEVTFATASTPSNVKFDLAGYNLGTGGGGSSIQ